MERTEKHPATILIVDDEAANRELLDVYLSPEGYRTVLASDGEEALAEVAREAPDLILLDVTMPKVSGYDVCARLKAEPATADIPILIITALGELTDKEKAVGAGADDFLSKPVDRQELLVRVRSLLKVRHLHSELDRTLAYLRALEETRETTAAAAPASPPSAGAGEVLIVDDEPLIRRLYADLLASGGYHVRTAARGQEALEQIQAPTDAILLDIMMPDMSGLDVLTQLRQMNCEIPVVILTAHPSTQNAITALRLGAFDFLVKGAKRDEILRVVGRAVERCRLERRRAALLAELQQAAEQLARLQGRAPGTGATPEKPA